MTPFAADLRAWIKRMGYTRARAAEALGVPKSTLDGWCAGRPCVLEGAIRKLMDAIPQDPARSVTRAGQTEI